MNQQQVILVNEKDEAIGIMEKMEAHQKGLLHRAFSVFIFDSEGRMLLQQRAGNKYHGAFLWTNTCCSHPYPGENVKEAAQRRLQEELGFCTTIEEIFSFTYHAHVENNLIEHEYDHVFTGVYEGEIQPDANEVAAYAYKTIAEVKLAMQQHPGQFTTWFTIAFPKVEDWCRQHQKIKIIEE